MLIVKETAKTTPENARRQAEIVSHAHQYPYNIVSFAMLRSLADQVEELTKERNVLMSAAKLALDALDEATSYTSCSTFSPSMTKECILAIEALKEAGIK